jgi:signal transduction histidine kinase
VAQLLSEGSSGRRRRVGGQGPGRPGAEGALQVVGSYNYFRPVGSPRRDSSRRCRPPHPVDRQRPALQSGPERVGQRGERRLRRRPRRPHPRQRFNLGIPAGDDGGAPGHPDVRDPVNGLLYFLLVAGGALLVAAVVASGLARRISAPLVRAVTTTGQLAGGRPDGPGSGQLDRDYPELTELAEAINTMGDSLSRSQNLERQFLLSVSHELRTPLTSIIGYADAIADGTTEDTAAATAVIGSEARRLGRLLQDLLDLARLDAQKFSLDVQRVDCAEVVALTAAGFRPEAESLRTRSDHRRGSRPPPVGRRRPRPAQPGGGQPDRERLQARGGPRWWWGPGWWGPRSPSGSSTTVRASPPRTSPASSNGTSPPTGSPAVGSGSGLGLAIVSELAAAMKAVVTAESPVIEGRGTRMTVWLRPPATPGD